MMTSIFTLSPLPKNYCNILLYNYIDIFLYNILMPFICLFHHLSLSIIDIIKSIHQVRHSLLFLPRNTKACQGSQFLFFP